MTVAELGKAAILLAMTLTVFGLAAAVVGLLRRLPELLESSRNAAVGTACLTVLASLALLYAFLSRDFSLRYVAETSSRAMPLDVVFTSFWGGQPGSLLLWATMLSIFSAVAIWRSYSRYGDLAPYLSAVLAAVQLFFLFLLAFVSSPFELLPAPVADGRGLNPLLWDDGMRIHPPLLLAGYQSFTIPFAFAVAALLAGRLGTEWLKATRRWMLLAWSIQGAGLLAGAWWAYHVLGWGGYWGWDPVENVALLPWLAATAYLHSVMVQERRGMLKLWNLALVIAAFALAIFGTFVVRSSVLSSVHSFAQSAIGPIFLGFLGLVLIGSLGLFFYRLPVLKAEGEFDSLASREAGFLLNNLLLASVLAATFWGTLFPMLSELFQGVKVAVGPPFYKQVNGPLLLAVLLLMGIGPLLAWRRTSLRGLARQLRWPLASAAATTLMLVAAGMREGLAILAFAACALVAGTIVLEYWRGVRARRASSGEGYAAALFMLIYRARRRYGGYLVHLAMVFIAVGAIGSSFFQQEEAGTLRPGDTMKVGRYSLTYENTFQRQEPGMEVLFSRLRLSAAGQDKGMLEPTRRIHDNWESQPTTGVAIKTLWPWAEDLYVVLAGWNQDGSATFRAIVNPLVFFIWAGGALFLLGTLISAWPEPSRVRTFALRPSREVVLSEA